MPLRVFKKADTLVLQNWRGSVAALIEVVNRFEKDYPLGEGAAPAMVYENGVTGVQVEIWRDDLGVCAKILQKSDNP